MWWNEQHLPRSGDVRFDPRTGMRKRFNGIQWRSLCRIEDCPLTSANNGLCGRHQSIGSGNQKNVNNVSRKDRDKLPSTRCSRELKTIIDGQNFLCEQNDREQQKKGVPPQPISTEKFSSNINDIIDRVNQQLFDLNNRVDILINIRNSLR